MATAAGRRYAAEELAAMLAGDDWAAQLARDCSDPAERALAYAEFLAAAVQPLSDSQRDVIVGSLAAGGADYCADPDDG
jgi:hypothetical protein